MRDSQVLWSVLGSSLVVSRSSCGLGVASCHSLPGKPGTGVLWVLTWTQPPPRQGGGGTRAPALTYVVALGGVVLHVVVSVAGGCFVVLCCLVSAHVK